MIAIVDYGMGNLFSVCKALEHVGAQVEITDSPDVLARADRVILPGVGAFGDAMRELERRGLVQPLRDIIASGKPLLGICLGLQILFESSEESPGVAGLGVLPGHCRRFVTKLKVPHMGWNQLRIARRSPVLRDIEEGAWVYFVHSFYVAPSREEDAATLTEYDGEFVSSVWRDNLFATQFHPEKSQKTGLHMLKNFVEYGRKD